MVKRCSQGKECTLPSRSNHEVVFLDLETKSVSFFFNTTNTSTRVLDFPGLTKAKPWQLLGFQQSKQTPQPTVKPCVSSGFHWTYGQFIIGTKRNITDSSQMAHF